MGQDGINKYFEKSIVVEDTVASKEVITDKLNGTEIEDYITKRHIPNPSALKDFDDSDGGLVWRGVKLVPPNSVQTDRPYQTDEISQMVSGIWDKYDGSIDEDNVTNVVTPNPPSGTLPDDWN